MNFFQVKSFNNKTEMAHELPNGEIFRYSYRFIKDDFVNTILLEISQEKTFYPIHVRSLNEELRIDEVKILKKFLKNSVYIIS